MKPVPIVIQEQDSRTYDPRYAHPAEDFVEISNRSPICAVSDGVTMELDRDGRYPAPSGAAAVAQIACRIFISEAEKKDGFLSVEDMNKAMEKVNLAVEEYNRLHGRFLSASDFLNFDIFAATLASAAVVHGLVVWATLGDAGVCILGADGEIALQTQDGWESLRKRLPAGWEKLPESQRRIIIRRDFRNATDIHGHPTGYGVLTGEPSALKYLLSGSAIFPPKSTLCVYTDGFREYFDLPEFRHAAVAGDEKEFRELTRGLAESDPKRYGAERSIVVYRTE